MMNFGVDVSSLLHGDDSDPILTLSTEVFTHYHRLNPGHDLRKISRTEVSGKLTLLKINAKFCEI
jgi:hypothetical protein